MNEAIRFSTFIAALHGGAFRHWREVLEGTAQIVEATADGLPARMRAGAIDYLGGWPDEAALARILGEACRETGIATYVLPEGLRLRRTPSHVFAFNYGPEPVEWDGRIVPAAGVNIAECR